MALDLDAFQGELPYDARYVGTFQPLLGWAGRLGKKRVRAEIETVIVEYAARVAVARLDRDAGPAAGMLGSVAALAGDRVMPMLRRAGLDVDGMAAAADRLDDAEFLVRMREALRAMTAEIAAERDDDGRAGPDLTLRQRAYRIALADLNGQPAFRGAFGGITDSLSLADLIGFMNELDVSRPGGQLVLSPVGLLDLYREYYFDLGTRLGPPIEHIWIAPGSDLELIENYSRTDYTFVESEFGVTQTETIEETVTESETFSEEVEKVQQRDLSAGVAAEGGVSFEVWRVSASASFDYSNSLSLSRRQALERSREASTKAAREVKRSSRLLTRRTTEESRSSTRTHRITNPTGEVRNLEMRRKYQHVGVQVQHLGTTLCWRSYVPHPGQQLELPELVHVGASEDFLNQTPPDAQVQAPPPETLSTQLTVPLSPVRTARNTDLRVDTNNDYFRAPNRYSPAGSNAPGRWVATDDPQQAPDNSDDVILAEFDFVTPPPVQGYELQDVRLGAFRGTDPSKDPPSAFAARVEIVSRATGDFRVILDAVNFEQNPSIDVTAELLYLPSQQLLQQAQQPPNLADYTAGLERKAREEIVKAVRERIRFAGAVRKRPAEDLRGEERSVVYRALIEQLVGSSRGSDLHLLSEVIQSIFDVERMLYYVAQDWWDPRRNRATLSLPEIEIEPGRKVALSPRDRARFAESSGGRDTYLVTEESAPAPLGRSLGWLTQLDGDDRRNMFLNSPWVQAVLPIRPGREREALAFMTQAHVEGIDGLEAEEVGADGNRTGRTIRQALEALAREIRQKNPPGEVYEAGRQVYEQGFRAIEGRVRLDGEPLDVFAQWIEVVPTRQVVPVPYVLPARFRPPPADAGADGNGG